MLDAEIAEKSGDVKKTIKLKTEAKTFLKQDWRMMMKNEGFPDIESLTA